MKRDRSLVSLLFAWGLFPPIVIVLVLAALVTSVVYGRHPAEHVSSTGQWGGLLAFALVCGLISFAVVEMVKRLLPVRQWLQQRYLSDWWKSRAESLRLSNQRSWADLMAAMGRDSENEKESAQRDDSVFGLPVQLLAAQISGAFDLALIQPDRYPDLYYFLTRSPSDARLLESGISGIHDMPDPLRAAIGGYERGRIPLSELMERVDEAYGTEPRVDESITTSGEESIGLLGGESTSASGEGRISPLDEESRSALGRVVDLITRPSDPEDERYFRASQRARSALDAMQIWVGGRWRRLIQAISVLVAILAAVIIQASRTGDSRLLFITSAALIGGPLAWTIRDATAVIERWRR